MALELQIADYESSKDGYFRGRAADLRDLRERVLDALLGNRAEEIPAGAIVVADDLAPSRFLATDWTGGGLVLHRSGTTSHVAILARARGVPMLVGIDVNSLDTHSHALLDAHRGELILDPDPGTQRHFDRECEAHAARAADDARHLTSEARTTAGLLVRVMINVARPEDLEAVDVAHTDGIGLVRTEFLFHEREVLPDEDEQYRVYRRILEWASGRPVTIRTLDAGGDKPIPGLTRDGETNPFLGIRGVRLSLRRPDVLQVQLRALARAATAGNLKIMVPMVTVPDELEQCRLLLDRVISELETQGTTIPRPELGMMVEVPAAAFAIEEFAADFYSIGSNDLLQYLAASSRDEPELAALSQPQSAFWRAIRNVVDHGRQTGRDVSLCGDLASDTTHVASLIECGVQTLSVAPAALAAVKAAIART
jgi:phosphotransferase system enzyme I (PtsI)